MATGKDAVHIDTAATVAALGLYGRRAHDATGAALYVESEKVMGRAKKEFVPVVTGTLRNSGHVQKPEISGNKIEVVLGFGGPAAAYALAVHENPRAGKTHGVSPSGKPYPKNRWSRVGGYKYLETPFLEAAPGLPDAVAKKIQEFAGRGYAGRD